MKRLALSAYLIAVGAGAGSSVYFWHVWSDNAYLLVYLMALALLVVGCILSVVALAGRVRWLGAIGVLLLAFLIGFAAVSSTGQLVAAQFLAGGNGSQSPCLLPARLVRPPPPEIEQAFSPRTSPEEIRRSEIQGIAGGLTQFGTLFIGGVATLLLAASRSRGGYRPIARGLIGAIVPIAFLYVRGPAAWCGQIFGLDGLAVIVAVAFAVARYGVGRAADSGRDPLQPRDHRRSREEPG